MHIGPYGEGAENGCGTADHGRKTSLTSIPSRTRMDLILSTARSEPLMFILPSLSAMSGRRFSGSRAARSFNYSNNFPTRRLLYFQAITNFTEN